MDYIVNSRTSKKFVLADPIKRKASLNITLLEKVATNDGDEVV
jgi:hypothetical protein